MCLCVRCLLCFGLLVELDNTTQQPDTISSLAPAPMHYIDPLTYMALIGIAAAAAAGSAAFGGSSNKILYTLVLLGIDSNVGHLLVSGPFTCQLTWVNASGPFM